MSIDPGTYIEITEGFFKGCTGFIQGMHWDEDAEGPTYFVSVEDHRSLHQFRRSQFLELQEPEVAREEYWDIMADILGGEVVAKQFGLNEGTRACATQLFQEEEYHTGRARKVRKVLRQLKNDGEANFDD